MSIKITATASGSLTPPTALDEDVPNGDFLIRRNIAPGTITGDGQDEETIWTFNFAGDPNFPLFSPSRPLTSALLTLTLTPKNGQITTDGVLIEGLGTIGGSTPNAPEIQRLPVGVTNTIQMQLLNRLPAYSSTAILGVFSAGGGQIPMRYADDSIISSAKLELIQESPAFQYAAKFVCGKSAGEVVAPGVYFTAINVHNPTYTAVRFRIKIAVALPGLKPGPVSKFFDAELGPDQALEIDCPDIFKLAETDADFLKGFVVIESDVELDVVVVYTAAGREEQVETLHTERVSPRRREAGAGEVGGDRPTMKKGDSSLDELYQDLADRFGALGRLFSQLSSPKATQELLNSLAAGDAAAFNRLIDGVELPLLGKCFWVREIIERVVATPTGLVEECWLRDNLTPDELLSYYLIAFRHSRRTPIAKSMEVTLQEHIGRRVIPPGAFLDELKANGLVTCEWRMTYDTSTTLVPGRPERVCL